jgi:hypothetical protein
MSRSREEATDIFIMRNKKTEIEYQHAVVLGTGHLPRWLAEEWEVPIDDNVASEIHDRLGICIPYGYRFRLRDKEEYPSLPAELRILCDWVHKHCWPQVTHVIFDSNGPSMKGLRTYEW